MIGNWPLLTIITFLPMIGVLFLLMIRGDEDTVARNARHVALWVSGFTFVVSLALILNFDAQAPGYQFEERADWLPGAGISYHLGVDGISMPFILLSTLLSPLAILASWKAITLRVREYMIAFLVLETWCAPYQNPGNNYVALIASTSLVLNFISSLGVQFNSVSGTGLVNASLLSAGLFIAAFAVFVVTAFTFISALRKK